MDSLRHLDGSKPDLDVNHNEASAGGANTVHFDARSPNAARCEQPEAQSVVVQELGRSFGATSAETTHVTRPRGLARWLSPTSWIIAIENHWVFVAVGLFVVALLFFAMKMRSN